ncbi:hypothetical protein PG994_006466 [Apiospora phragmitis]|uniref:Uncharacterized protein n=1 Tax=Apiospora phragmitis TaxID=2905665 RepID=A0ABR1VF55_9PEZI
MPRASKRKSDNISDDASSSSKKNRTSSAGDVSASHAESSTAGVNAAAPAQQQRLTTPDLEFDYDRSQLRDPRPTPGRVKRPRHDKYDLTESEREKFRPPPLPKPKGRLGAFQKDKLFEEESLRDPTETFHDLYVCYRKGREGSPTYDTAGFELDYDEVCDWMKPKAYSKSRVVKGMEKSGSAAQAFDNRMLGMFFEDKDEALEKQKSMTFFFTSCIKDKISKVLGIPWHKIGMAEL